MKMRTKMKIRIRINMYLKLKTLSSRKGSMVMTMIFIVFTAMITLSLLTFSITHTRIVKARGFKAMEMDKLNQALIYHLHYFREQVFNEKIEGYAQPEIQYFNKLNFPGVVIDNRYSIDHSFTYVEFAKQGYKKTRVTDAITASISMRPYGMKSGIIIDILSGKIPLEVFPLFVNTGTGIPEEVFMNENRVVNNSDKNVFVGNMPTEINIPQLLLDSLIITGTTLNWIQIREKLKMPASSEPIPEGVYAVLVNGNVESIVIQGDVDQVIFLVDTTTRVQKIQVIQKAIAYDICYKPGENYFLCWDNSIPQASLFKEKLLVNGNIRSIEQRGTAAFLLQSNITLFSSGTAVIKSNLEPEKQDPPVTSQGVAPQALKVSNFKLICAKDPTFKEGDILPGIVVDKNGDTVLQASMITTGKFTNNSDLLHLYGSLYCSTLENKGEGNIEISFIPSPDTGNNYFRTGDGDYKYIDRFLIQFIEEVSYGDE